MLQDTYAIIGSAALARAIPYASKVNDLDLVCSYQAWQALVKAHRYAGLIKSTYPLSEDKFVLFTTDGRIIEADVWYEEGEHTHALHKLIAENSVSEYFPNTGDICHYANKDILYMLKMSHRYKKNSPHFLKTMAHIHLLRDHGAEIKDYMKNFYEARMALTYNYKHPKLNQSKDSFFNGDGVPYVYDHDSIHEAVKIYRKPAYKYFKPDENEVFCDKDLFFQQQPPIRLASVVEESCVLAIERCLLHFGTSPKDAFLMALEKVCTSITSGWWREYAWEYYYVVAAEFEHQQRERGCFYNNIFKKAVDNNEVLPYSGSAYNK